MKNKEEKENLPRVKNLKGLSNFLFDILNGINSGDIDNKDANTMIAASNTIIKNENLLLNKEKFEIYKKQKVQVIVNKK